MKIAFLGGGNMARALIGGLAGKGYDRASISVVEVSAPARERLVSEHKVHVSPAPDSHTQSADVLVLATKPQDLKMAVDPLAGKVGGKLVISIAAGVRTDALSRWLGGHRRLVRCMPNTPALIGAGIAALYALPEVGAPDREKAEAILRAVGEVVWVEEERLLDPVTALSASGPAYVFWFIEHLAASGEKLGLERQTSLRLAMQMVLGAAKLAAQSADPPGELRRQVTSKGGTTEAALKVFAQERLAEKIMKALEAASRRGAELGDELGKD
jgi:pyrroline-5-carboxylate reductase